MYDVILLTAGHRLIGVKYATDVGSAYPGAWLLAGTPVERVLKKE